MWIPSKLLLFPIDELSLILAMLCFFLSDWEVSDSRTQGRRSNSGDMSRHSGSSAFASPVNSDHSMASFTGSSAMTKPQSQQSQRQRPSDCSAIMGIDNILQRPLTPPPAPRRQPPQQQAPALAPNPTRTTPSQSRYHLHIRQQPIAARACGAGDRDRRPVDPPPIVQMLLTDFNLSDVDILQDPRFTVGCLLFPVAPAPSASSERHSWESRTSGITRSDDDSGNLPGQSTPLLSGKAFVSPFDVDADPDPVTAPAHPSSYNINTDLSTNTKPKPDENAKIPSTFFIFSDLSVRTAGLYRLQFRLMNWGSVEDTGQSMPILAEAWSEPFRVYPAKDFPGMRDSSPLAEGLKEMGFVELKTRGKGKGKGRRR